MILVPDVTPDDQIADIRTNILFMSEPRTSFITIGSTILHLTPTVADMFYVALPKEVRNNLRCLTISNMKYVNTMELVIGIEPIVPTQAIKDIYYFQRANGYPVTYTVVLKTQTTEPITIVTGLIDKYCYEENGRIKASFGDVKPTSSIDTIQSRNIFAIDPINLSNPYKKMSASIRGTGITQKK
jgi:hypothetical protein